MASAFKRGVSGLLAVLTCLILLTGIFAGTASADTSASYMITFPRDGDACQVYSEDAWGHPAKQFMNGWSADANDGWPVHAQGSFEGQVCYCIEPGLHRGIGDSYESFGEDFWDNWPAEYNATIDPDTIKLLLGRVMQYGYQGNLSADWKSQDDEGSNALAHIMATQILVWETIVGERDADFELVDAGGFDTVRSCIGPGNPLYDLFRSYYSYIEACVQSHATVPSFMARSPYAAPTVELEWDGEGYSAELYDHNGVARQFTFGCDAPGVTVSVSGDTVTIFSGEPLDGTVSVWAEKGQQRSGVLVWTDGSCGPDGGNQDVVTYTASVSDPVAAFLDLKISGGTIYIVKTSEDGNVSGVSFRIEGNGVDQTVSTGSSGIAVVSGFIPGTYTVTELTPAGYEPQAPVNVTVVA